MIIIAKTTFKNDRKVVLVDIFVKRKKFHESKPIANTILLRDVNLRFLFTTFRSKRKKHLMF